MEDKALEILDAHRLMVIATVMPDGWPQATMVGYANEGLLLYFVISRQSQKFANIDRDQRVAIVVGRDFKQPEDIKALSLAAIASEVTDPKQRERAIDLIIERHDELKRFPRPSVDRSAIMRAAPSVITLLDYGRGIGHADILTVAPGGYVEMAPARADDWGFLPAEEPR
jgi:nitroimidazol reductase NimA-like FMN-containing flavoprotein (pyridoxamine 5'-phosphate oxidase superfamily)